MIQRRSAASGRNAAERNAGVKPQTAASGGREQSFREPTKEAHRNLCREGMDFRMTNKTGGLGLNQDEAN